MVKNVNIFEKVPLPQSFFATSILCVIISAWLWLTGRVSDSWGVAFLIVFFIMLIASFTSIAPDRYDV